MDMTSQRYGHHHPKSWPSQGEGGTLQASDPLPQPVCTCPEQTFGQKKKAKYFMDGPECAIAGRLAGTHTRVGTTTNSHSISALHRIACSACGVHVAVVLRGNPPLPPPPPAPSNPCILQDVLQAPGGVRGAHKEHVRNAVRPSAAVLPAVWPVPRRGRL